MSKKRKIIDASLADPRLGPTAIAKLTGASLSYVEKVRTECGFNQARSGRIIDPESLRQKVIQASKDNPNFGCVRIARLVGADKSYTRRVRSEFGFKLNHIAPAVAATTNEGGLQSLR